MDLDPKDYKAYYNRGNAYLQLEYYNKAINDYEHAIIRNTTNADIYLNKGNCHFFLKQFDLAVTEFDKAIGLDARNYLTYFNKGKTQIFLEDYVGAEVSLQQAVDLNDKYPASFYWLGVCNTENGNKEEGCLFFKQAAQMDNPDARKAVAELCPDF